jgi:hypothetical protein
MILFDELSLERIIDFSCFNKEAQGAQETKVTV